jgi:hypothetical protein
VPHNTLEEIEKGILRQDTQKTLYVYGQELRGKMMFGIIGLLSLHVITLISKLTQAK